MEVTWLGHASFQLSHDGTTVVIDPYGDLRDSPAPERRWDFPRLEGLQADVVLITHDHGDHNRPEAVVDDPLVIRWKAGRIQTPAGQ
jgi:L-ascorbate metabolism protein UlaG (beta-lactamase superfamily)